MTTGGGDSTIGSEAAAVYKARVFGWSINKEPSPKAEGIMAKQVLCPKCVRLVPPLDLSKVLKAINNA